MTTDLHREGALAGLRVLDATQMLAGPLAGTRLGDLGADVIKVESPNGGEFNRTHGFGDQTVDGQMTTFVAVNRNKRSLAIDLKDPEALTAFRTLIRSADVFIQNFRRGTATRLGIGYEQLRELNPRLIYCSISGYGASGPYADRPGQDLIVQGYSGSMFSVGRADDDPAPGALWAADVMTGYQAVIGILAALQSRERTGDGQHVEVDMYSVVLDAQLQELVTYLNTGFNPQRSAEPSAHAAIPAPYGVYRTADGWLTLAMSPLPALGAMLDDPWLASLSAYNDGHDRRDEVFAHIRDRFVGGTTAEWVRLADEHGVWAGPVYDYPDLVNDPHLLATGTFVEQPSAGRGAPVRTVRPPIRLSGTPTAIRKGAPALGADSVAILRDAGVDSSSIDRLIDSGALLSTRTELAR
ncbi:crotonobetainyl-CoA:carnitine CoA-transferase CaiB-like acyl-CoA transferase [Microbacterium sp. SLBN-154]|uniref:CaiB/BaiF CoA transferase family protein n=1 Tax=Microbacterium sp. SLBN-154 TaxID=2768458 RepID=UPI001153D534|nr:CaiB/BaiF CoA-transferase family protein [Microbacterium sp. SLBN-154]TQK17675.1 crotonobetainyl-CoA:carnitine CoA-transferase CaiB-like acyl-CoA transferase [Microbacterium sp. SLBN-154]